MSKGNDKKSDSSILYGNNEHFGTRQIENYSLKQRSPL